MFTPRGVMHIGAHAAEEKDSYDSLGVERVVWVEANPVLAEQLKKRLSSFPDQLVLNYLVLDIDNELVEFKVANNGESSSVLDMERHLIHHPHIHVVDSIHLQSKRLDSIIADHKIDCAQYDFLNLDIQGVELEALGGLGDKLGYFNYVYTEVNIGEVYSGCSRIEEIDAYLAEFDFKRRETRLTDYEWGDAFYVKEKSYRMVFDIGANVGKFTAKCLKQNPRCEVVLVEPNKELIPGLETQFRNRNVVILNELVSSADDEFVDFFIGSENTISTACIDWMRNSRFSNSHQWSSPVRKRTVTLSSLVARYGKPDLIKVDVEGYEYEVFLGLDSKQGEICFEWSEEQFHMVNMTCEHLVRLGYKDFGYIFKDEYLKKPDIYTTWQDCKLKDIVEPNEKNKWGMIWAK